MDSLGQVFEAVSNYFALLSEPVRLRILHSICREEKSVSQIVAETGARLAAQGVPLTTFVSPNVPGVAPDHNLRVFDEYARRWYERGPAPVVTS